MDDREKTQQELDKIQQELKTSGLSRRKFLDRLKAIGVGFGAAAVVGAEAANAATGDIVSLQSSNKAIGSIVDEGREQAAQDPNTKVAQYYYRRYRRFYRRYRRYFRYRRHFYRRFYRRYRRFYY